jgi:hypothetical protein
MANHRTSHPGRVQLWLGGMVVGTSLLAGSSVLVPPTRVRVQCETGTACAITGVKGRLELSRADLGGVRMEKTEDGTHLVLDLPSGPRPVSNVALSETVREQHRAALQAMHAAATRNDAWEIDYPIGGGTRLALVLGAIGGVLWGLGTIARGRRLSRAARAQP